jgi:TRAP-type C4-dicarboxylate transport system substrate-binding protein
MSKKILFVVMILVFVLPLILGACGGSNPQETFKFTMSTWVSEQEHTTPNVVMRFADTVQQRSGGRIEITVYPNGSLGPGAEHFDMARTGVADICLYSAGYTPGRFPLTEILGLPFAVPTAEIGTNVATALRDKGYLDEEYADVKLLSLSTTTPYPIMTTNKRITKMEDLNGLQIRSPGGFLTQALEDLGATPISMASSEIYSSLERGVIEGVMLAYASAPAFKLEEVIHYSVEAGLGAATFGIVMNKDSFESLPPDLQEIVVEVGNDASIWGAESYDTVTAAERDVFIQSGIEINEITGAELQRWQAAVKPIWDAWVQDTDNKGLPGQEVYNEFVSDLAEEGVILPY